ncbi:MAG TPA: 50S ribosomal protein L23 [Acidimicrobiia bacterium]|nr:50S ribosomal protein L23 [Acidimicrobiia bacterium]
MPQPRPARADRAPRGAERLRRARERLARVQPGDARRVPRPKGEAMSARNPRDIIIRPVVSEKSYAAYDNNVYTFLVAPDANKIEIKQAIEAIFSVKVTNVNTLNRSGKRKRNRRTGDWGKRADQRRAIVSLAEGDSIEIFGS